MKKIKDLMESAAGKWNSFTTYNYLEIIICSERRLQMWDVSNDHFC